MAEFTVQKSGNVLYLSGYLEDTTDFAPLDAHLPDTKTISFKKIFSFNWLGLQNFVRHLTSLNQDLCFTDIQAALYRQLLVFPELGQRIKILDFEVAAYSDDGRQMLPMTMAKATSLLEEFGCFAGNLNGIMLAASLDHLCRPAVGSAVDRTVRVAFHPVGGEEVETYLFWYDYASFALLNVESCAYAQRSSLLVIEEMMWRTILKAKNLHFVYKVLVADDEVDFTRYSSLYQEMLNYSNQNFERIFAKIRSFEIVLIKFEECLTESDGSLADFVGVIQELIIALEGLSPIAATIDATGAEIGEKLRSLAFVSEWRTALTEHFQQSVDTKGLQMINRKLKLGLNIDTLSQEQVWERLGEVFNELDDEFSRCSVALQQFDLIGQVFQHRVTESMLIKSMMPDFVSQNVSLAAINQAVLDQVGDRLVTDLEKLGLKFFFPEVEIENRQRAAAGDMMFF